MVESLRVLVQEHEFIKAVLSSFETALSTLGSPGGMDRADLGIYARFFDQFCDGLHHSKEEDVLFPALARQSYQHELGPVAILLAEHMQGRDAVTSFLDIAQGHGTLTPEEQQLLRTRGQMYAANLRAHVEKENSLLFPEATKTLPFETLAALLSDFEKIDMQYRATLEEIHTQARRLLERYPAA